MSTEQRFRKKPVEIEAIQWVEDEPMRSEAHADAPAERTVTRCLIDRLVEPYDIVEQRRSGATCLNPMAQHARPESAVLGRQLFNVKAAFCSQHRVRLRRGLGRAEDLGR